MDWPLYPMIMDMMQVSYNMVWPMSLKIFLNFKKGAIFNVSNSYFLTSQTALKTVSPNRTFFLFLFQKTVLKLFYTAVLRGVGGGDTRTQSNFPLGCYEA